MRTLAARHVQPVASARDRAMADDLIARLQHGRAQRGHAGGSASEPSTAVGRREGRPSARDGPRARSAAARRRAAALRRSGWIQICRKCTVRLVRIRNRCIRCARCRARRSSTARRPASIMPTVPVLSLVRERAPDSTTLMISMLACRCGAKPPPGATRVLVDHAQRTEAHPSWVVVMAKENVCQLSQPAQVGMTTAARRGVRRSSPSRFGGRHFVRL
jgi:hypothetical protein